MYQNDSTDNIPEGEVSIESLKDVDLSEERKHEVARIAYETLFLGMNRREVLARSIARKLKKQ